MWAIILLAILFVLASLYIRIADRLKIVDKPNQRSSHVRTTIRGGGIIFPLSWFLFSLFHGFAFPWFTAGLLLIAAISFWDDTGHVPAGLRFFVHLSAFALCFHELGFLENLPWGILAILFVMCIGIVNAVNFMDGINGITGLYSLSIIIPLMGYWPGADKETYGSVSNPLLFVMLALVVFGYFNFRKKARCFAGDVGSVSIGYIILFFLLMLFVGIWIPGAEQLNNYGKVEAHPDLKWKYILFLSVYGVDSILTIFHRLILRENIFQAHRKHLYQYLSNEMGWPHLVVAGIYSFLQLVINIWLLQEPITLFQGTLLLLGLAVAYLIIKIMVIRKTSVLG